MKIRHFSVVCQNNLACCEEGSAEEAHHARINFFVVRGVHGTNDANDSSFSYREMWTGQLVFIPRITSLVGAF